MKKRQFSSGAMRNSDEGKIDYEAFLSPTVLKAYGKYMHKNRKMEDGTLREGDDWQKGIPCKEYMKSMWRHFLDVWSNHRGIKTEEDEITNLCGVLFNAMGMLHDKLKNPPKEYNAPDNDKDKSEKLKNENYKN